MARWSETRGYTLVLRQPRGPDRYARLALVKKRTLFGPAFNVREARAEDPIDEDNGPEAMGGLGRLLSWRWLGELEATELMSARLRTLEALGYAVLDEPREARGPWDWLRELVQRQLARPTLHTDPLARQWAEPHTTDTPHGMAAALREALERLGLQPAQLIEGIATVVEVEPAELREPSAGILAKLEPELLAMLLPFWIEHEHAELRALGQRWLGLRGTLYELDRELLERWLCETGLLAKAIEPRLAREGLALLGPEGLLRLAHRAKEPSVRAQADRWRERLREVSPAPG